MENKKISIIIPSKNEEKHIVNCLDSIIESDFFNENIEIIIVDGMSTDNTLSIIQKYQKKYTFIKYFINEKVFTPFAFNIGIQNSIGKYIFIVSAHCKYQKNYFSILTEYIEKLDADAVGAVSITGVINKNKKSSAIKKVLSNKFGVGNSYFRTGTDKIIEVDAISGCYNRRVFDQVGLYNEKLIRNQDIELNKRIKNNGGKLFLIPYTEYTYFVRENFKSLANNNYKNGMWNILTAYYTGTFSSLSLRHFIPLILVLSILIPLILSMVVHKYFIYISVTAILSYFTLMGFVSWKINDNSTNYINLIKSFFILHFSYGVGSLVGIIKVIKLKFLGK